MKKTAIAYVDGYNLYYGLKKADLRRCAWLNLRALVERLLPNCTLYADMLAKKGGPVFGPPSNLHVNPDVPQNAREHSLRKVYHREKPSTSR